MNSYLKIALKAILDSFQELYKKNQKNFPINDDILLTSEEKDALDKAKEILGNIQEINSLKPVFEKISFLDNDSTTFKHQYTLQPLDYNRLESIIFPIENQQSENFSDFLTKFEKELKVSLQFNDLKKFYFYYYLAQKYLWCITISKQNPDLSMFDYVRVLSAISISIFDYYIENQNIDWNNPTFLIYEADISGIQKFIYKVNKTPEMEEKTKFSIPKVLRGRSFFISILPELLSRYILHQLDYPITNLLYAGGGKFQLILPNTEKVKKILEEFKKTLSNYLFEEFHTDLGIVDGYIPLGKKDFEENQLKDVLLKLQLKLDQNKKRKFSKFFIQDFKNDTNRVCQSCHSLPPKDDHLCKWCKRFNDLGEKLVKSQELYITYIFKNINKKPDIDFSPFGKFYLLETLDPEIENNAKEILLLNSTDFSQKKFANGFKFLANLVPTLNPKIREALKKKLENQEDKNELNQLEDNSILSFNFIAEFSKGDKKLGILRADLDNLGLIFSDGLKDYSLIRIATLSRMLDLFFTAYICILIDSIKENDLDANLIYTVYSGGDDLFLIGPYHLIIKIAVELRKRFYYFTAKNLDLGISSGLAIFGPNVNIPFMAKSSEESESLSKKAIFKDVQNNVYIKDAISIFNKSFKYSSKITGISTLNKKLSPHYKNGFLSYINFETILSLTDELVKFVENKKISRSLLFRILSLYNNYIEIDGKINPLIYPKIYYQIGRNVKDENAKKSIEEWFLKKGYKIQEDYILRNDLIRNLDVILSLAIMYTRGGRTNDE